MRKYSGRAALMGRSLAPGAAARLSAAPRSACPGDATPRRAGRRRRAGGRASAPAPGCRGPAARRARSSSSRSAWAASVRSCSTATTPVPAVTSARSAFIRSWVDRPNRGGCWVRPAAEKRGIGGQRAGQRDPLPLAARQLLPPAARQSAGCRCGAAPASPRPDRPGRSRSAAAGPTATRPPRAPAPPPRAPAPRRAAPRPAPDTPAAPSARCRRQWCSGLPSSRTVPPAAGSNPSRARSRVDFPAPFGPMTALSCTGPELGAHAAHRQHVSGPHAQVVGRQHAHAPPA